MNHLPSSFEALIHSLSQLPGIGKKTAMRLAMHIVDHKKNVIPEFLSSLEQVDAQLTNCTVCGNYADDAVCTICRNPKRRTGVVCVVESVKDLIAIEETGQFSGSYHVLGGLISPIDGIGPDDLRIDQLLNRIKGEEITELIMAISSTIEGDTTLYYISQQVHDDVSVSSIARGVAFGGELEYADDFTLGRAILRRTPIDQLFNGDR
ncbi:recombination mediator RecR [Membranicola marinus]|uniref:Recombination protein RecR n=1 Tax=Membranihabitans marinus TaxID=1227546 RepID=A0A953HT63_9BACT|nr:recombination mediator RecR [Membranihabitans marinus]MBY5957880.1 recombination mediator RecR [Membranihabitans marinus]